MQREEDDLNNGPTNEGNDNPTAAGPSDGGSEAPTNPGRATIRLTLDDLLTATATQPAVSELTLAQLALLLRIYRGSGSSLGDDDDDDDNVNLPPNAPPPEAFQPATTPQEAGVELLMSGEFGRVGHKLREKYGGGVNLAKAMMDRRYRTRPTPVEDLSAGLVPNTNGTVVAMYDANVYSGQFSLDSSFYYTCCQDFRLHIYDMTHPSIPYKLPSARTPLSRRNARINNTETDDHETTMKVTKTIRGQGGRWTVTDSHLSPDNERMIYSSHTSTVYMVKTLDSDPNQTPLNFADPTRRRRGQSLWDHDDDDTSVWSARFSADGNEVVAGGNGKIFVYDILANRRTVKINAHEDDVNSVCWADTASGNVLVSASDDSFLKVWDRRSLGAHPKPSGVLIGHTEGITYVSAKGDGRYVISNGKDQALRLWDLRKMRSSEEFEEVKGHSYGVPGYDYRYGRQKRPRHLAHPKDCSVMAYRGHAVVRTLIRCHFSPAETTGGAYIYSGSADGRIHIWSLDGRVVQVLDRRRTLPITFDPSAPEFDSVTPKEVMSSNIIRDVSWHSSQPILMSAAWEGNRAKSCVARHEWKGLNKMSGRLEDWVERKRANEAEEGSGRRGGRGLAARSMSSRRMPGFYQEIDSDDSDPDS